jgi:ZIP family zinc transporter
MDMTNFWPALGMVTFAGLATGIGSLISFLSKNTSPRFLAIALGFSAGVMIYVSFMEILPGAGESFSASGLPQGVANFRMVAGFFAGIALMAVIDLLVPKFENPHEVHSTVCAKGKNLHRLGVLSAIAIAVHNFPEGLATFAVALQEPRLGVAIAIAIAIHNIPEGIAISVPIYCATGSRKKAFRWSFLSGLSEPLGALIGFFFFRAFFTDLVLGWLLAGVAGIMVYISLDELLPTAEEHGEHHLCIMGLVAGMAVMAGSLLLLE